MPIKMISTRLLRKPENYPRISDKPSAELVRSIAEHGILEPLIVFKKSQRLFGVYCGTLRLHAARKLQMGRVPCHIVPKYPDFVRPEHRVQMTPEKFAEILRRVLDQMPIGRLAKVLGKSVSWIRRKLKCK